MRKWLFEKLILPILAQPWRTNSKAVEGYIRAKKNRGILPLKERNLFLEQELEKANKEIMHVRAVRDRALNEIERLKKKYEQN